jgi:Rad3-related DNA helicase
VNFEKISLIADEAHEMESFARDAFTVQVTHRAILGHLGHAAEVAHKHKQCPDDERGP